ncbi:MAG: CvpA family protein [Betaproteobacteria bacterium]|nr:CvpA family protein [Betaproteobacteria bacterium]
MTWFDWITIGVIGCSALLGLWHGFIREVFALVGWAAAGVCAATFGSSVAEMLPSLISGSILRLLIGVALTFVGVRFAVGLISFIVARLAKAVGLGIGDRMLGGLFGAARGVVVLLTAVLIAGLTSLPQDPGWRDSMFANPLVQLALVAKPYLPPELVERIQL